jgi:FAD/FMN-containing dehydrogenase
MPASLLPALAEIAGAAHVFGPEADRARWLSDAAGGPDGEALAVVRPGTTEEVAEVMRLAHRTGTPVVPLGGNTGLAGGGRALPGSGAIVLSLERLNRIREIRPAARLAVVEAGVVLDTLHRAAEARGLRFPLFFGARGSCTLGGNLSTNAGGSNVLRHGSARAQCLGLEVVTPQGEVMDLMSELHKDNTGYALKDLYIGAEGTLGVITAAVLRLAPLPRAFATAMVAVPALADALALLNRLQEATGGAVEAFEYMPGAYLDDYARRFPDRRLPFADRHEITLLVELASAAPRDAAAGPDGRPLLSATLEDTLAAMLEKGRVLDAALAQNMAQRDEIWQRREAAWEVAQGSRHRVENDIALPLDRIEDFLGRMAAVLPRLAPGADTLVVGHLGDGNLHYTIRLDRCAKGGDAGFRDRLREAVEEQVAALGGSFSAEHGIGTSKLTTMARRKNPVALATMRAIRKALDPKGIMNPGKVLP